jgi:hypothetical protein
MNIKNSPQDRLKTLIPIFKFWKSLFQIVKEHYIRLDWLNRSDDLNHINDHDSWSMSHLLRRLLVYFEGTVNLPCHPRLICHPRHYIIWLNYERCYERFSYETLTGILAFDSSKIYFLCSSEIIFRLDCWQKRKQQKVKLMKLQFQNSQQKMFKYNSHYFANVFEFISNSFSSCFSLKNFIQ